MSLTDAENAAVSSLLSGGPTNPLEQQAGEEKPIELAMFGRGGSDVGGFVGKMLFGDLYKSRKITEELKTGERQPKDLKEFFADKDLFAEPEETVDTDVTKIIGDTKEGKIELKIPDQLSSGQKTPFKPTDKQFDQFQEQRKIDAKPEKGLLTDFRVTGSRGDDKIPDEQSVRNTMEAISVSQKDEIEKIKRGKLENQEIEKLADLVGLAPKTLQNRILARKKGEAIRIEGFGMAETMYAARTLLQTEIKKLDELAEIASSGADQSLINFRQQFELVGQLQAQIKGSQTEIARSLQQFKMPVRDERFTRLRDKDAEMMLDQMGGSDGIKTMVSRYLDLDTETSKAHLARNNKGLGGKIMDAFYEYWINALLSSPVTHMKNVAGAFMTTFAHVPETYVAAGIGAYRRQLLGRQGGVEFGEANAQMFGAFMSFTDAWRVAKLAYKTGEKPILGSKLQMTTGQRHSRAFSAEAFGASGTMGNAVNALGKVATLGGVPTGLLEFEDTYFKVVAQRMSLYQQGYREGKQRNVGAEDFAEFIANYINEPPENAIKVADAHAQYVTLQNVVDEAGKALQGVRNFPLARYFIPFFKTPYNAFKYAFIERSALGLLSANLRETIAAGKRPGATAQQRAASDMATARQAMGAMTSITVLGFTAMGVITGGGPADREHNATLRRQGWQPYSIRIGDTYYSYMGAEPFTSVISMMADVGETLMVYDTSNADAGELAAAVVLSVSNQLTDKTFMQGFSNLVDVLQDPQRYASRAGSNFVRSLVPRILAQAERQLDPTVRDVNSILDTIKSQIPGLSSTLPPNRNVWGQSVIMDGAAGPDVFSPVYTNTVGPNTASIENNEIKIGNRKFDLNTEKDINLSHQFDKEFAQVGYGPSRLPDEVHKEVALEPEERNLLHQLMGHQSLEAIKKWSKSSANVRRYNERKDLYLKTGNTMAFEKMQQEFDKVINNARDSVLDISGNKFSGLFFNTELGKQYRQRLTKHIEDYNDAMKASK
tara:strand:+ start:4632 stop:7631 length:3000 start_codon:yes stop_codon:yes gene_type:complete